MLQEFLRINKEMHFHSLPYNFVFRFVCLFFFNRRESLKRMATKEINEHPCQRDDTAGDLLSGSDFM